MLRCRTRSMVERLTLLIPPKSASSSITRFCISFSLMALSWRTMSMISASCCWENIGRLPLSRGRFASLQKGNKQLQKYNKTLMGISFQSKFVMTKETPPKQNNYLFSSLNLLIMWSHRESAEIGLYSLSCFLSQELEFKLNLLILVLLVLFLSDCIIHLWYQLTCVVWTALSWFHHFRCHFQFWVEVYKMWHLCCLIVFYFSFLWVPMIHHSNVF